MKKGVKIGLIIALIIGVSVGAYFLYKSFTNGEDVEPTTSK